MVKNISPLHFLTCTGVFHPLLSPYFLRTMGCGTHVTNYYETLRKVRLPVGSAILFLLQTYIKSAFKKTFFKVYLLVVRIRIFCLLGVAEHSFKLSGKIWRV